MRPDYVPPPQELDRAFVALTWMTGRIEWKLHEAQRIIHNSIEALPPEIKEATMLCSRRFGKSFYGCFRGVAKGLQIPGRITRIIGPEVAQTRGIVKYNMAKIKRELEGLGLRDLVKWYATDNMFTVGKESQIFIGGYDSQEDNQRGGEAHEILIEETGTSKPDDYTYQMRDVLKPQLLKTRGRMIHLTTLPPVPDHPFTLETIPQCQLDGSFYSYTIYDDPLATPEIIADAIKDCGGAHTDAFKREYMNVQIRDKNLVVLPDYDDSFHNQPIDMPLDCKPQLFIDTGGVRDFTVALIVTHDFYNNMDLYWDELWWPSNTATSVIVRDMRKRWEEDFPQIRWRTGQAGNDPQVDGHGQTIIDMNKDHEFPAAMVAKGEWKATVNQLNVKFHQKGARIDPRCKLLRQTCRSGVFNDQKTDFGRSEVWGHCDAIAAAMYANRCLDRSSPYGIMRPSSDTTFVMPKTHDTVVMSDRSFVQGRGMKKFGGYRR